ncbi:MAG TPA: hypothetical protein ENH85_02600 [Candidatus Scalindua sp.]|nr:hypothetical protein [Candidatus Scalindua sp.]
MKPKTNREKVKHIRDFKHEFPGFTITRDQEFLLMLARYTDGKELTPEAWEELDTLYQHVKWLEKCEECNECGKSVLKTNLHGQGGKKVCKSCLLKGPGDEATSKHPRFMRGIDWKLLRDQKKTLLYIDPYDHMSKEEKGAITGVIHLLDAIQDYAVDSMGKRNREVFNLPG